MSTTATPGRVRLAVVRDQPTYRPLTVTTLDRDGWDEHEIAEGQGLCMAAVGFTLRQVRRLPDEHPGVLAWERVVDEAIVEISPQVRDLLYAALERRLPWTWEPER